MWNVIYVLYLNAFHLIAGNNTISFISFIKGFLIGTNYGHFYFIPLSILFYLLYPLLRRWGKSHVGLILSLGLTIISQLADVFTGLEIFNAAQNIFNWSFYFIFGIWLAHHFKLKVEKINTYKRLTMIVFILSFLFLFFESFYSVFMNMDSAIVTTTMRPLVIPYSVLFTLTLTIIQVRNKRVKYVLNTYSKNAFEIYLSHCIFQNFFDKIIDYYNLQMIPIVYIIGMFILVSIFSVIASKVQKRIMN